LIGGILLTGPSWMRRRTRYAAEKTLYLITDERAIICDGGYCGTEGVGAFLIAMYELRFPRPGGVTLKTFEPRQLRNVELVRRADNTEDLLFLETMPGQRRKSDEAWNGFFSITGAMEAQRLLRSLSERAEA
jgi:hypothetical protein